MVTEQNTAAQVARLREMAGKFKNHADLNRDDALSVRNGHVLRMYVEGLDGYASDVSAAADALEREAGLVADAERWRHVRQDADIAWFGRDEGLPDDPAVYEVKLLLSFPRGSVSKPERLDAAIDAARGAK